MDGERFCMVKMWRGHFKCHLSLMTRHVNKSRHKPRLLLIGMCVRTCVRAHVCACDCDADQIEIRSGQTIPQRQTFS